MLEFQIAPWIVRVCRQASVRETTFRRAYTLERVRGYLETHLGAHNKDVAEALGLSPRTVGHYIRLLRLEWKK
jgi:hypothetical protein